jgi:hypothetical protein
LATRQDTHPRNYERDTWNKKHKFYLVGGDSNKKVVVQKKDPFQKERERENTSLFFFLGSLGSLGLWNKIGSPFQRIFIGELT